MLRRASHRLRHASGERRRYERFQAEVEPALASRPRVHRFAEVPIVADASPAPAELGVCVDLDGGGDATATRASLDLQTVSPASVAEASGAAALDALRCRWIVVVRAGDRLAPTALERVGQAVTLSPEAALVTCDDDLLDRAGARTQPRCSPGPSPDLLLARDHSGELLAIARETALAAALAPEAGAAWRYELALRLAGGHGRGHAHVPLILCHRAPVRRRPPHDRALVASATRALAARGEDSARVEAVGAGRRRVRRALTGEPTVEVIVGFRDRPELLARCARSVLGRSSYERLSLRLVDNGSSDPGVDRLLASLSGDPRVIVERDPRPFNFSALNNAAAARTHADVLVFLNNDVEVLTGTWAEELLEEAQREEVGAVAPLLLYGDGRVQHVGAAIGIHGFAGHPFAGLRPEARTPFGSAEDGTRNWMAVTAACMMVQRSKFEAVGGFDESFAVGGNDVDLCLRLTAAGHRSLCVPHVRLRHDESSSRDPLAIPSGDYERSRERYGAFRTIGDPFYNPNLSLTETTCAMRAPDEEGLS